MKNLTKLAAAVSLALLAGNASAALDTPASANGVTGLSNLLFSLEDTATTSGNFLHTFALDLGVTYNSIVAGATGLSWDLSTVTAFNNFAADTASLRWSVVGGAARSSTNAATFGALATSHNGATDFPVLAGTTGGGVVKGALISTGAIGAYEGSFINPQLGANAAADINPFTSTASLYTTKLNNLGGLQDSTGLHTTGVGSNDLWKVTVLGNLASSPLLFTQPGTFSLSSGNVLTYVAAVPVPAAVWLFGSALAGFLGLSRRNKQVSAIAA